MSDVRFFVLGSLAALFLTYSTESSAQTSSGFVCPKSGRIVERGDNRYIVRSRCGEPDSKSTRYAARTIRIGNIAQTITVEIEEWFYDFGRQRFTRTLYFENGELFAVETGGYGIKD